jgi:hypothetical protein
LDNATAVLASLPRHVIPPSDEVASAASDPLADIAIPLPSADIVTRFHLRSPRIVIASHVAAPFFERYTFPVDTPTIVIPSSDDAIDDHWAVGAAVCSQVDPKSNDFQMPLAAAPASNVEPSLEDAIVDQLVFGADDLFQVAPKSGDR